MMAANLHTVVDLRYEEEDILECSEDKVLVKIKNYGICGSDAGRILAHGTYHFSTIPRHKFAGREIYDKTGEIPEKSSSISPTALLYMRYVCGRELRRVQRLRLLFLWTKILMWKKEMR